MHLQPCYSSIQWDASQFNRDFFTVRSCPLVSLQLICHNATHDIWIHWSECSVHTRPVSVMNIHVEWTIVSTHRIANEMSFPCSWLHTLCLQLGFWFASYRALFTYIVFRSFVHSDLRVQHITVYYRIALKWVQHDHNIPVGTWRVFKHIACVQTHHM